MGWFGSKKPAEAPLSEAAIRDWLTQRLGKQLKVDPSAIDVTRTFEDYGLDSIVAVRVSGDLEKLVEQRLSPALLFEHSSIQALSRHLAAELGLDTVKGVEHAVAQ